MKKAIHRREFILGVGAGLIAAPAIVRAEGSVVIRAGALKLTHSIAPHFYDQFVPAGYKMEVLPFETPTECKNAVVTKSVDFGAFGIAAAILGAAAGEPVVVIASTCNRGMAIIAKKDSGITSLALEVLQRGDAGILLRNDRHAAVASRRDHDDRLAGRGSQDRGGDAERAEIDRLGDDGAL